MKDRQEVLNLLQELGLETVKITDAILNNADSSDRFYVDLKCDFSMEAVVYQNSNSYYFYHAKKSICWPYKPYRFDEALKNDLKKGNLTVYEFELQYVLRCLKVAIDSEISFEESEQ